MNRIMLEVNFNTKLTLTTLSKVKKTTVKTTFIVLLSV